MSSRYRYTDNNWGTIISDNVGYEIFIPDLWLKDQGIKQGSDQLISIWEHNMDDPDSEAIRLSNDDYYKDNTINALLSLSDMELAQDLLARLRINGCNWPELDTIEAKVQLAKVRQNGATLFTDQAIKFLIKNPNIDLWSDRQVKKSVLKFILGKITAGDLFIGAKAVEYLKEYHCSWPELEIIKNHVNDNAVGFSITEGHQSKLAETQVDYYDITRLQKAQKGLARYSDFYRTNQQLDLLIKLMKTSPNNQKIIEIIEQLPWKSRAYIMKNIVKTLPSGKLNQLYKPAPLDKK
jgi:hypothetical protein